MDFLFKLRTTVADKKTQKLNGYPYLVIRRNPCATGKQPRRLDSTRKLISSTKVDFFRLVIYPTNRKIFCALFYGKIFFSMSRIRAFQPSFYPFLNFLLSAHRRRLHRLSLSFFFLLNFPPLPPHEMGLLLRTRSVAATSPLLPRSDSAVTQFDLPPLPSPSSRRAKNTHLLLLLLHDLLLHLHPASIRMPIGGENGEKRRRMDWEKHHQHLEKNEKEN